MASMRTKGRWLGIVASLLAGTAIDTTALAQQVPAPKSTAEVGGTPPPEQ